MITILLERQDLDDKDLGMRIAALFGLSPANITQTCGDLSISTSGPSLEKVNRASGIFSVTPGQVIPITIGAGGAGSIPAFAQAETTKTAGEAGTFQAAEEAPIISIPTPTFIPPIPGATSEGDSPLVDTAALFGAVAGQNATALAVPLPTSTPPSVPEVPALPAGVAAVAPQENAAPSNLASGVEVDKEGLPWDGRIHSESKAKNKDGTWRARRNLPDGVAEKVTAELRSLAGVPPATPTGELPPLPNAAATKPTEPATAVTPFNQMLRAITPHLLSEANPTGKLKQSDVVAAAAAVGLENFMLLQHREDLLPAFIGHINNALKA